MMMCDVGDGRPGVSPKKSDELSEASEFRNSSGIPGIQTVAEIVRVLIEAAEAGKDINLNR